MLPLLEVLKVYDVHEAKQRLGRNHDGGYVVNDPVVYNARSLISLGIGNEMSFEVTWHKVVRTPIVAYDASCPCTAEFSRLPNARYVAKFVGNLPGYIPLSQVLAGNPDALLKVDIEGGEYTLFDGADLTSLVGLIIEIHGLAQVEFQNKFVELMRTKLLPVPLVLYHVHGNTHGGTFPYGGYDIPETLELSFVHSRFVREQTLDTEAYPLAFLDCSNNPAKPDYPLPWINRT